MKVTHALNIGFSLLIASQSARADPAYCVRGPKLYTWVYSTRVNAAGALNYSEVTLCIMLSANQHIPRTWCEVHQDHDAGLYVCGPGVSTLCDLDSFQVYSVSDTPKPGSQDGSHQLCWTVRNSQPNNVRYFDFYIEEKYTRAKR